MAKKSPMIYQFKITLDGIKPPIWRRIQVPESYTFWDFHIAIQDAMGWLDYHLHQFEVINPKYDELNYIGIPSDGLEFEPLLTGWKIPIKRYFSQTNAKAKYEYDFGDSWWHIIVLEKILPVVPLVEYPLCIGGRRACPPEDCGGSWGYENLLQIIADPNHEEHESMIEWLGEEFHPEIFNPATVIFDSPRERLKTTIEYL